MNFRQITPFMILMIFIALMLQVGCDTLVTENNTTILVDTTLAIGCFDCHTDTDNPLIRPGNQFDNSAHANTTHLDILFDKDGDRCGDACHTHEGFLQAVDDTVTIQTKGKSTINCYTCHLPHTGEYGEWEMKVLRGSEESVTLISGLAVLLDPNGISSSNTCANCHKATNEVLDVSNNVELSADFGPHVSPQADILSGKNGYFVDISAPPDNSHLENGCVKCHYGSTLESQGQGYTYAEHTFRLEDQNSLQQYNMTCNVSGCHVSTEIEENGFFNRPSIADIDTLSTKVKALLASFEIIDSSDTSGLTYTVGDTVPRTYAEAYYNYLLYKNDGSRGVHNAGFVNTLLSNTRTKLDSLPPIISFTVDDSLKCFDDAVTFTPTLVGGFDSLYWKFSDNTFDTTTADTTPLTIIFGDSGIYNVTLEVLSYWDSSGTTASTVGSLFKENYITLDAAPTANFTFDLDSVCVGEPVTFTSTSQFLLPASMIWDFGDADSAFLPEVSHSYATAGTYFVSLEVTTNCGVDDTLMVDSVVVLPSPTAVIDFAQNAAPDTLTYQFTDVSTTSVSRIWDFLSGSGTDVTSVKTAITDTTTVTFPDATKLQRAVLTILNINGCQDVDTVTIYSPL